MRELSVALVVTLLGCSGAESFRGTLPDGATLLPGTGGAGLDGLGSGGAIGEGSGGATGTGSGGTPDDSSGGAGGHAGTGGSGTAGSGTGGAGTGGAGTGGATVDAATVDLGSSSDGAMGSGGAPGSGGAMDGGSAGTGGAGGNSLCTGVATYSAAQAANYQAGDKVVDGNPPHLYRCQDYPANGWCRLTGYEPADPSGYWTAAWDDLGPCN